jgi:ribosome maturation factor RimP
VDAETVTRPVVEGAGLELVEVTFARDGGRRVLRVVVDRDTPVDLDTIASLSEKLSRRLDLEDFGGGAYALEVSSPGIERPLKTPEHFRRVVGDRIVVKTAEPLAGARSHRGRLLGVEDDAIVLDVDGAPRRIAFAGIISARTLADWDAELKGARA